ncbi:MAG TPA: HNH endonuclease signature motif containing protein [Blastococcus sp.]|nr:HNH endonuclease signature motif containing protein [Blastococcus sp.]
MSPGAAREHVRLARALTGLPLLSAAFVEGRLSYSKVRALTRIAEPDTEASLLDLAIEATASQTERLVRSWRRAEAVDHDTIALKRQFDHWWDDDGMLVVRMRMDAEEGAHFLASVDSLAERDARRERAAATREGRDGGAPTDEAVERDEIARARERTAARRCAAVAQLADAARHVGRRPGDPARRDVVVHVDAAVVADDAAGGQAYLEGGPALRPSQVRRMLCEATVVTMLERGREVLGMGRRRRLATRAQRRALLRRDGGCARPGCTETRIERLHAHHMRWWAFGGRTDVAGMVLLCDVDHGLVHELDLVMTRRDGKLVVLTPDGSRVWGAADAAFAGGVDGCVPRMPAHGEEFAGVAPIDEVRGRRPAVDEVDPMPADRPRALRAVTSGDPTTVINRLLFPEGSPPLPDAMHVNGERMDMRHVVGVLMGNRDLVRRLAAEARGEPALAA